MSQRLAELLRDIAGSTLPAKGTDAAFTEASFKRLMALLKEKPEPIAIRALEDWPRQNRYFPLEADLARALDRAAEINRACEAPTAKRFDDGMQDEPVGATLDFIKEFRRINPTKCAAYFDPPAITRWSHNRIGTRIAWVADIVERHAPGLIAKHGVRIVEPLRYHPRPRQTRDPNEELFDIEWRWS